MPTPTPRVDEPLEQPGECSATNALDEQDSDLEDDVMEALERVSDDDDVEQARSARSQEAGEGQGCLQKSKFENSKSPPLQEQNKN